MGHEEELEAYRSQLLESVSSRPGRSVRGLSDFIQVYVNERRAGELEGARIESTLHVNGVDHIETVQLRTEDGMLLGGLVASECGFRTNRIRLSSDWVELCVHNTAQGGSLSAVFVPAPSFWSRTWKALAGAIDSVTVRGPEAPVAYGMRTVAFTQVLLAIAVVGLVTDRMGMWTTPQQAPAPVAQSEALLAPTVADMAKLEQQLGELTRMQEKVGEALDSQQRGMVQLHQVMTKLSSTQESVVSSMVMVKEEVKDELEKRLEVMSREVERTPRHLASKGRIEQEQLEAAIRNITSDNDRLSKEVASLEEHNQTLKTKLQSAVLSASKAVDPNPERLMVRQADIGRQNPSLQITETPPSTQSPFLFWVTFSEGTSQESIDQWVNQMKGHKGVVNEGWQEVQILPPPVPPDRFLEQIKGEKIVKEARLSH